MLFIMLAAPSPSRAEWELEYLEPDWKLVGQWPVEGFQFHGTSIHDAIAYSQDGLILDWKTSEWILRSDLPTGIEFGYLCLSSGIIIGWDRAEQALAIWDGDEWDHYARGLSIDPGGTVMSLAGTGKNDLYLACIARTEPSVRYQYQHWDGLAWTEIFGEFGGPTPSIWIQCFGADDVFACRYHTPWHYDGTCWAPLAPSGWSRSPIRVGQSTLFMSTGGDATRVWLDGGLYPYETPGLEPFVSMAAFSPEHVWAADMDHFWEWTRGDWLWRPRPPYDVGNALRFHLPDESSAFVSYRHYKDGERHIVLEEWSGETWESVFDFNTLTGEGYFGVTDIWSSAEGHVFVATERGHILHRAPNEICLAPSRERPDLAGVDDR